MAKLAESIEERIKGHCKEDLETLGFFRNMISKGELKAYDVEINKRIIEKDTEDEEVVRTVKGATLTPTDRIPLAHKDDFFLKDPAAETLYYLDMDSRTSNSDFKPFLAHMYGHCSITKLVKNPDLRKLGKLWGRVDVPKEMISGRLYYGWDHDIREGTHHKKSGYLTIEGEQDNLFAKVAEFIKHDSSQLAHK